MSESNGRITCASRSVTAFARARNGVMIRIEYRVGSCAGLSHGGNDGALYVGDEKRAFAAYVFEHVKRKAQLRSRTAR